MGGRAAEGNGLLEATCCHCPCTGTDCLSKQVTHHPCSGFVNYHGRVDPVSAGWAGPTKAFKIWLNHVDEREAWYSQSKLELHGVFHASRLFDFIL